MNRRLASCVTFSATLALVGLMPRDALADPTPHEQALDLFQRGGEAYRAGKFPEAIDLLSKAYDLEHDPTLLYNIARSYENLGDLDHAAATYEKYLQDAKDIKDRPGIEQHVATMKKQISEKAQLAKERDEALKSSAKKDEHPGPSGPVERRPPSPVPWVIAAVGVGGLAAGAGLGATAISKNDSAGKAPSQLAASNMHDSAKSLALGSTIAFIAGGVLAGVGLTWGVVDIVTRGPVSNETKADVKVTIGPARAGLRVDF
jgi:tetratricopeptide (TPR) repeat protein